MKTGWVVCKLCGFVALRTLEGSIWSRPNADGELVTRDLYRFDCPNCGVHYDFEAASEQADRLPAKTVHR
jgi:rubredoxin